MLRFSTSVSAILCVALREFEKPFRRNKECGFHGEKGYQHKVIYSHIVFRPLIETLLKTVEPEAVANHRQRGFCRRHFWAAGVNNVWPQDQHDKWGRFGLWLHAGIEAFSGEINWMKIWWMNKNPHLVAKFFLDTCHQIGGMFPASFLEKHLINTIFRCSCYNSKQSRDRKLWCRKCSDRYPPQT